MSKKCCNYEPDYTCKSNFLGGCKPSLPTLIILILILLQFGGKNYGIGNKFNEGIDNGILFIIALFYLSCCNPCKTEC